MWAALASIYAATLTTGSVIHSSSRVRPDYSRDYPSSSRKEDQLNTDSSLGLAIAAAIVIDSAISSSSSSSHSSSSSSSDYSGGGGSYDGGGSSGDW